MNGAPDRGATPDPIDDEELSLVRARAGDRAALERLYADHVGSARRLAILLAGADGADDLVAESFARVLDHLRGGRGPTTNFRGYLHATIRNRHRDNLRAARERPSSDIPWMLDSEEPPAEDLVEGIDSNGAVAALQSLPASWQQILWYLDVEGYRPAEVAELLKMTPVAVSSLAYRARDGLRRAYLDRATMGEEPLPRCRWTRDRLSRHVRGDLSPRASGKVREHVSGCAACAGVLADMEELNRRLAGLTFPIVLVGGMTALDLAVVSGGGGPLTRRLRERSEAGASTVGGAATSSATGFLGMIASANVSALVSAAVAGLVIVGGTVWAVTAHDGSTDRASSQSTPTIEPTLPVDPRPTPAPTPASTPTPAPARQVVLPPVTDSADPVSDPAPTPVLVVVRAEAPAAVMITACETYGSLTLPSTTGVRYTRTSGDGRQGVWRVNATAIPGYVLAESSPRQFSGDLGDYFPCPPLSET